MTWHGANLVLSCIPRYLITEFTKKDEVPKPEQIGSVYKSFQFSRVLYKQQRPCGTRAAISKFQPFSCHSQSEPLKGSAIMESDQHYNQRSGLLWLDNRQEQSHVLGVIMYDGKEKLSSSLLAHFSSRQLSSGKGLSSKYLRPIKTTIHFPQPKLFALTTESPWTQVLWVLCSLHHTVP